MSHFKIHIRTIITFSLFVFLVFLAASTYMRFERDNYALQTRVKIAEQETTLAAIAELVNRDGADAVVEQIILDCSPQNRERFDTLLSNLAELHGTQLVEVEQLFNACGNFFAERKAVMVARLEREYEVYKDLIEILALADKKAGTVAYDVGLWGELVSLEKERSTLSSQLVDLQGRIITSLLDGESVESDAMQLLLVEGKQTREKLFELSAKINTLRESLLSV